MMIRLFFVILLLSLAFNTVAQTLLVKVDFDQDGYQIDQIQVLDRSFDATSVRPAELNALRYQFLDATGVVIAQGIVQDPSLVAGEFHNHELSGNDGEITHITSGSFVIRVPYNEAMVSLALSRVVAEAENDHSHDHQDRSSSAAAVATAPDLSFEPIHVFDLSSAQSTAEN
jgi:hypothetical protein